MPTSSELRQKFLNEHAEFLLEEYGRIIRGETDFKSLLAKPREDMWGLLCDIIKSAKDLETASAKTTDDVLTLLSENKITADDAVKLLTVIKIKQDIEELPKLIEMLMTNGIST